MYCMMVHHMQMVIFIWVRFCVLLVASWCLIFSRARAKQNSERHYQSVSRIVGSSRPVSSSPLWQRISCSIRQGSYIPGWDCHGLPIENKALKAVQVDVCIHFTSGRRHLHNATVRIIALSHRKKYGLLQMPLLSRP